MSIDAGQARAALLKKLEEISRRHGAISKHLRGEDGRLGADFEDRVSFTEGDEVLEAADDAGRTEVVAIRGALDRLDAGTYGTCVRCEGTIAPGRLVIIPEAALCTACAGA